MICTVDVARIAACTFSIGASCGDQTPASSADDSSDIVSVDGDDAWHPADGDRSACANYCARIHTCVSALCPPDYWGDAASFLERCADTCVSDQQGADEAHAFADVECAEVDSVLCETRPDIKETCSCSGPVTRDGTVCGVAGLVDHPWVEELRPSCANQPELDSCRGKWIVIASDGTYRRYWTPSAQAPSDQNIPDCDAGEWTVDCQGKGFGFIWFRSCSGTLEVVAFELGQGLALGPAHDRDEEPPMALGPGHASCEPIAPCAAP